MKLKLQITAVFVLFMATLLAETAYAWSALPHAVVWFVSGFATCGALVILNLDDKENDGDGTT